jgi:NAD(P)-dependent dehydrogenase (short-subunit alcohol dehydrogenase family)
VSDAPRPLSERVVVVTGGSRGIGEATAFAFARLGADVAIVARHYASLDPVVTGLRGLGVQAIAVEVDLRDGDAGEHVVEEVARELGPVDVLVNNAAIQDFDPIASMTTARFADTIAVNLTAPFGLIRAALPGMVERRRGWIVNVASDLGYRVIPGGAAYCASKRGLIALSESVLAEHRDHGVRVTVVMPGATATRWDGIDPSDASKDWQMSAEDVAEAIVWCCLRPDGVRVDSLVLHPSAQATW